MQKTILTQTLCDKKENVAGPGYVAAVKTFVSSPHCVDLTMCVQGKPSEDILMKILNIIKERQKKGITIPEIYQEFNLAEDQIQSHVDDMVRRFLVKSGGKKRHGHPVWVAR